MDTKNYDIVPEYGKMRELRAGKVVVGAKQLKKALLSGQAWAVYLAQNADPAITEPIAMLCEQMHIPYYQTATMAEIGRACGIDVGAAAAAAVK